MSFPSLNGSNPQLQPVAIDSVQCASVHAEGTSTHYPSSDAFPETASEEAPEEVFVAPLNIAFSDSFSSVFTPPQEANDQHSPYLVRIKSEEKNAWRRSNQCAGKEDISHSPSSDEPNLQDDIDRVESSHTLSLGADSDIRDNADVTGLEKEERAAEEGTSAATRAGEDIEAEYICDSDIVGEGFTTGKRELLVAC
jgi:hypothetical protein